MRPPSFKVLVVAAMAAGLLVIALAVAALLITLSSTDALARYPGSVRLGPARVSWATLPRGYLLQSGAYLTPDDAGEVIGWYARGLRLQPGGEHRQDSAMSNCQVLTRRSDHFLLGYADAVTLCLHPGGTLIFVQRSLVLRRPW
jgi:hypothetical protein